MKDHISYYTVSIGYDRRLYRQDISGSIVHARMLAKQGIITVDESAAITEGLRKIRREIEDESFQWRPELEDIHMNVERRLYEHIGDTAGKLHTARSRNDQIGLDVRMYVKDVISEVIAGIDDVRTVVLSLADAHRRTILPGYTHLQRAQPVLFAHHMLAYFEMLTRDRCRFEAVYDSADVMPLGSGALAGVPYNLDREYVAKELGFSKISANSMDAVSDRDYLAEFHAAATICMVHFSRLAEELIVWSTDEFGFVRLADEYTTGSSIMPQKRNPDFAEIARGKTGRVLGHLVGLLTTLKGIPLTYNRDMQEDKEGFFDTVDTLIPTLYVFKGMLSTMRVDCGRMRQAAETGYMLATDIADYLVARDMPFREAHGVVARLSDFAYDSSKTFGELTLREYKEFSGLFDEDVFSITVESSITQRNVFGGTAFNRVERSLAEARDRLEVDRGG